MLSQNKFRKGDLSKATYIYDVHIKSGWGVLEIFHMFVDSIVFKLYIYCSIFADGVGGEGQKISHFLWTL